MALLSFPQCCQRGFTKLRPSLNNSACWPASIHGSELSFCTGYSSTATYRAYVGGGPSDVEESEETADGNRRTRSLANAYNRVSASTRAFCSLSRILSA